MTASRLVWLTDDILLDLSLVESVRIVTPAGGGHRVVRIHTATGDDLHVRLPSPPGYRGTSRELDAAARDWIRAHLAPHLKG